jgi:hypothetical protein
MQSVVLPTQKPYIQSPDAVVKRLTVVSGRVIRITPRARLIIQSPASAHSEEFGDGELLLENCALLLLRADEDRDRLEAREVDELGVANVFATNCRQWRS